MTCDTNALSLLPCAVFFSIFLYSSFIHVFLFLLGKTNANSDHPDYVPSIFNFTKADTVKKIQKVRRFLSLQIRYIEISKHLEGYKKVILCINPSRTSFFTTNIIKTTRNFYFNVCSSLTDDISRTPTKTPTKIN